MGLFTPRSGFLILRTRDEAYPGSSWDLKIVVDFAGNRVSRPLPMSQNCSLPLVLGPGSNFGVNFAQISSKWACGYA